MLRQIALKDLELAPESLQPLTCRRGLGDLPVAGTTLAAALKARLETLPSSCSWSVRLWPSRELLGRLAATPSWKLLDPETGHPLAWSGTAPLPEVAAETVPAEPASLLLRYPWDLLRINELALAEIQASKIDGTFREGAVNDGILILGEGSVVLPGVYVEGTVVVGRHCKIGPNCYLRGATVIGDHCHIGQAVEIKNSVLMDHVAAGHLSYIGDSIVASGTNFGAGTITANFRHDGKNHRSQVDGVLVDTGRLKLGAIIGDHVHTGIHTAIYPGRKLWPDTSTLPGTVVQKDLH